MAVTAWLRSMNKRCYGCWNLVYAVCTWKPERLEQIIDIPVPHVEEEIDRRGGQIPSLFKTVPGTSTLRKSMCFRHELV